MRLLLVLFCCIGLATSASAQTWSDISYMSGQDITCLETAQNALLAGTGDGSVHISTDAGTHWRTSRPATGNFYITAAAEFQGKLFLGTSDHGIYTSTDTGRSWTASSGSFFAITSFAVWNGGLYASSMGSGILQYDAVQDSWAAFTDGLPTYSFNVNRLLSASNGLTAAAGANGTVYRINPQTRQWEEGYYTGNLAPGLSIDELRQDEGVYFASSGRHVYRSDDNGQSWTVDEAGMKSAQERYFYAAGNAQYLLANDVNTGAWLQWREKPAVVGNAWTDGTVAFPSVYAYAVRAIGGKLFIAHTAGVMMADAPVAAIRPQAPLAVSSYPNPSSDGAITVEAPALMTELHVTDLAGQQVLQLKPNAKQARLSLPRGAYLVQVRSGGQVSRQRVTVL